jgi:hypothetical protein
MQRLRRVQAFIPIKTSVLALGVVNAVPRKSGQTAWAYATAIPRGQLTDVALGSAKMGSEIALPEP